MSEPQEEKKPSKLVTVAVFGALVIVIVGGLLVWWNSRDGGQPDAAPTPTSGPIPPQGPGRPGSAAPPSSSPSTAPSTPVVVDDYPYKVVLVDRATLDEDGTAMLEVAEQYLRLQIERDYNQPYPGFDAEAQVDLTTDHLQRKHEYELRDYEEPRQRDLEVYQDRNREAGPDGFKQTLHIIDGYVTQSEQRVVFTVDAKNTDGGPGALVESSFWVDLDPCTTNDQEWCVSEFADSAPD